MEYPNNENSQRYDMPQRTSRFDSILLEPPTTAPPLQAPKPSPCQVPDFESVNFSVTSNASECDNVVFSNDFQNGIARGYPSPSKYNKISPIATFSKPTPSVRPKNKNNGREEHEPALSMFQQCKVNFNPNINSTPNQQSMQTHAFPKVNQFSNNSSRNRMTHLNGEYMSEFGVQYERNSPISSDNKNICGATSNFENVKTCEPHDVADANLLNQSDSVTLLPQQLQFHETNNAMNGFINTDIMSSSKHMSENDLSPLQLMKMNNNFRNHHNLDGREKNPVHPNYHQESQPTESGIFSTNSLNCINTNAKTNISNDIWSFLCEQNEKIKQLQNQLITVQQQNNAVAVSKQETPVQLLEDKKFEIINNNLNNILQHITDQNNSILTMRYEISVLAKRTDELESKSRNNISEQLGSSSAGGPSNAEAHITPSRNSSNNDVMCHKETHVKKTSSSTMTSITIDAKEKVLFCNTTVFTENCQRDVLLQRPQNENSPADNTRLNKTQNRSGKVASNVCSKNTTPKALDCKKPKTKSKQTAKSNNDCENVPPKSDLISPVTQANKIRIKNSIPLADSNSRIADPDIIIKNIADLVSKDEEKEEPVEKHCSSCHCGETNKSPGSCAGNVKSKTQKNLNACANYSASEDSDDEIPNLGWTEDEYDSVKNKYGMHPSLDTQQYLESRNLHWREDEYDSAKKKYGMHPSLLSLDTQQYLEKHRLYGNLAKRSSQSRGLNFKPQLR